MPLPPGARGNRSQRTSPLTPLLPMCGRRPAPVRDRLGAARRSGLDGAAKADSDVRLVSDARVKGALAVLLGRHERLLVLRDALVQDDAVDARQSSGMSTPAGSSDELHHLRERTPKKWDDHAPDDAPEPKLNRAGLTGQNRQRTQGDLRCSPKALRRARRLRPPQQRCWRTAGLPPHSGCPRGWTAGGRHGAAPSVDGPVQPAAPINTVAARQARSADSRTRSATPRRLTEPGRPARPPPAGRRRARCPGPPVSSSSRLLLALPPRSRS